jgi:hypothetical protein
LIELQKIGPQAFAIGRPGRSLELGSAPIHPSNASRCGCGSGAGRVEQKSICQHFARAGKFKRVESSPHHYWR